MKRFVYCLMAIVAASVMTSCDPEWALDPRNTGYAYVINNSDSDITFRGYTSFSGQLYTDISISPRDTVCVSATMWDERSNNWDDMIKAGWDPFLATVALREYSSITKDFDEWHHRISISTSPTDSISWTLDVDNIEDNSIFNELNWEKKVTNNGCFIKYSWTYTIE